MLEGRKSNKNFMINLIFLFWIMMIIVHVYLMQVVKMYV